MNGISGFFLLVGAFMVGYITPEMMRVVAVRDVHVPVSLNCFVGFAFAFIAAAAVFA